MKFNNHYDNEPTSYTYLKSKLDVSIEEFNKSSKEKNIDSHSQIKKANLYANRLKIFINEILKKNNISFLDCGCGLGFISRELNRLSNFDIHYCDPSVSVKKIHEKIFPKENFFQSDIENLKDYKKKFDIIYMREVYPFTRNANYENQIKLIKILNNQLKDSGLLIFEQIKNKDDLLDNLPNLNVKYKVIPLPPARLGENKFLNKIFLKNSILQFLLKIIYRIFGKKISYLILIYRF